MKIFELMDRKRTVKVFVGGNGHIAFEKSKKEIDAELVLEKLTSDDSKQSLEVQILKFLRNKHTNEKNFLKKIKNKNEELYKIFKEVLQKKDKRLHKKIYEHEDRSKLFQQQIIDSIRKKVENMIEKQTKYRRSESRWVDPKNEVSVSFSSNQADIDQTSWYIWSSNGK
ncbi:hypothetical protein SAMN04244560_02150 [Thermoanaerobacter thermohydrosulfuricus]|uniref:Uncharacterized protein n=1 Tax=Thermoanaerobacter thermohydrosulfuricus TaxID=1516 RepID=A0A1G7TA98_THETY|nr:hypothetical protein [Thermoanaerobacter thermohydrosulfuricus]SDG32277.1 hypothetical protein SAMN04244560_02150 [Thermoanaerobacter thermohydrosulfuricus]